MAYLNSVISLIVLIFLFNKYTVSVHSALSGCGYVNACVCEEIQWASVLRAAYYFLLFSKQIAVITVHAHKE